MTVRDKGAWLDECQLRHPPELTPRIATSHWQEINLLFHSLATLQNDLVEKGSFRPILRTCIAVVAARRGLLYLTSGSKGQLQISASFGFGSSVPFGLRSGTAIAAAALQKRKPLLVSSSIDEQFHQEFKLLGDPHCLTIPIVRRGIPWGVVQLVRPVPFYEEEGVLLWLYALILEEMLAAFGGCGQFAGRHMSPFPEPSLLEFQEFRKRLGWEVRRSHLADRPLSLLRIGLGPRVTPAIQNGTSLISDRMFSVIRRSLRRPKVMTRFGERDLFICLPTTGMNDARRMAQGLRRNLLQSRVLGDGVDPKSDVRIAIVTFPEHGNSDKELLTTLFGAFETPVGPPSKPGLRLLSS